MTRTLDVLVIESQRHAADVAGDEALASLRRTVLTTIAPLLRDEDVDPAGAAIEIERQARALHVRVQLPVEVDQSLRQAVSVRALAALHGARGNHATIGISVIGPD